MATRKLSQIAVAGSPPALTDQVVGVTGGTTDNLYSLSQIQATAGGLVVGSTTISSGTGNVLFDNAGILGETILPIPAVSNVTYYVATTGSDSNPGTIGSPFATLSHALIVAARFNWQLLYTPTIHVADGTYTAATGLPGAAIPPFINLAVNNIGVSIIGNSGTPANVVIQNGTGGLYGLVQTLGSTTNVVTIDGMSFLGTNGDVVAFSGILQYNSIICNGQFPIIANGPGAVIADNPTGGTLSITITSAAVHFGIQALNGGKYFTQNVTLVLPVALTIINAFLNAAAYANMTFQPGPIVNFFGAVGTPLFASNFSVVFLDTAYYPNDVPGNLVAAPDNSSLMGFGSSDCALFISPQLNINFSEGTILPNTWGIIKDETQTVDGKGIGLFAQDNLFSYKQLTPETARVAVQFDKTNDAALADIPGMTVNVGRNFSYQFQAVLFTTSNAAGGVQASIGGTGTISAIIYEGETTNAAALVAQTRATAKGTSVGGVTAVTAARIEIKGLVTTSALGTLTVQFAQNVSNGTASSVLVGSYMIMQQIV